MTPPAQAPTLSTNDMRVLVSLRRRVWGERFGSSHGLFEGFIRMFHAYDSETLERVCQSAVERYSQVLRELDGNDFETEHTGTRRKRQREV